MQAYIRKGASAAVMAAAILAAATAMSPVAQAAQDDAQQLGTITITGDQLRLLQDIKAALKRQFSYDAADRDKMVCRIQTPTGSRLHKALVCGTNHDWYTRADRAQLNWFIAMSGGGTDNTTPVQVFQSLRARNMAFQIPLVSAAAFKRFMQRVPNAKPAADAAKSAKPDQHD